MKKTKSFLMMIPAVVLSSALALVLFLPTATVLWFLQNWFFGARKAWAALWAKKGGAE